MIAYLRQESALHGVGVFASQDLRMAEAPGIPLIGQFGVFDNVDRVSTAMAGDGIPRNSVCADDQFKKILKSYETCRDGAALYLKPDPVGLCST